VNSATNWQPDWDRVLLQEATARAAHPSEATIVDRLLAERSLYDFVSQAWHVVEPGKLFVPGWHTQAISEHLEAVTRGQIRNLLIMVPPGCTKTTTVCIMWPAWEWINSPETRWLFSSYSLPRAQDAAQMCSVLLRSKWYLANWGRKFHLKTMAETELHNSRLGFRKCVSVQSGTTGEHGDRLVIDDAHNVKDVESDQMRAETIRWHDHAWFNRVNDPMRSTRVVIGQRTHAGDLMGHLDAMGNYEVLRIPEEFEADRRCSTSIGWSDPRTQDGELMRPERFGPEQIEEAKYKTLGSAGYAAQHQQRPAPKGGALFKRGWFKRYHLENGDAIIRQGKPDVLALKDLAKFVIVDGGASSKQTSDPTAIVVFGVTSSATPDLLVLDVTRERLEWEDIVPMLQDVCLAWHPDWVGIESNGFQVGFSRVARDKSRFPHIPQVRELKPEGKGKAARAAPAIIMAEAGEIYIPDDSAMNPWVEHFEEEHYAFTGKEGGVDDVVDCVSYAVLSLSTFGYDASTAMPLDLGRIPHYPHGRFGPEW